MENEDEVILPDYSSDFFCNTNLNSEFGIWVGALEGITFPFLVLFLFTWAWVGLYTFSLFVLVVVFTEFLKWRSVPTYNAKRRLRSYLAGPYRSVQDLKLRSRRFTHG